MVGSFIRLAAAAVFCGLLGACTSTPSTYSGGYESDGDRTAAPPPGSVLQCVPYAREHSHIPIYGDAYTWWDKAEGRYARSTVPSEGSVLVLVNYAGAERAHLAVVRSITDSREIRVDHANWFDDGEIFVDDPVRDVSPDNDWSQVRVYNFRNDAWGGRIYPVQGFIGPGPDDNPVRVAQTPPVAPRPSSGTAMAGGPPAATHDYVAELLESDPAFSDDRPGGDADGSSEE